MRARRFTDPHAFNDCIAPALALSERENNLLLGIVRGLTEKPDDQALMVAHRETTTRTARIGPVYTPGRLRGNGYASAAVAEVSRRLLAAGRAWCLLFADVENPTSTGIYRRLGYQEVCLFREYRFGG